MHLRASQAAVEFHTILFQREHIIVVGYDFYCEVRIVRIICKPNGCLDAFAAQDGHLVKRQIHSIQNQHKIRALRIRKLHQILPHIGNRDLSGQFLQRIEDRIIERRVRITFT
ncbi:hypothetical protein D3C73_694720 [compost metagenome]